jgi:hypothetical protein
LSHAPLAFAESKFSQIVPSPALFWLKDAKWFQFPSMRLFFQHFLNKKNENSQKNTEKFLFKTHKKI